jgi:hypothetical protein
MHPPLPQASGPIQPNVAPFAKKGSQRWLQVAVNLSPDVLNDPIATAVGSAPADIVWISPLRAARFQEYRDDDFVSRCGLDLKRRPLKDFWPRGGPMWDGLARAGRQLILVEAKGHIPEIVSPRSHASEPARGRIRQSMEEAQRSLSPKSLGWVDWTGTFYQYANRVAHLHFLREHNALPVHLVNVYFLHADDVRGPKSVDEWKGAITVVKTYLGLGRTRMTKYMHDVFVDVRPLVSLTDRLGLS